MKSRLPAALTLLTSALVVAACSTSPRPDIQQSSVSDQIHQALDQKIAPPLNPFWWQAYSNPTLDQLIDEAFLHNQTLAATLAQLDQTRAQLRLSQSALGPSSDLLLSRTESRDNDGTETTRDRQWQTGLSLDFELDLRGKLRAESRAARLQLAASEAAYAFQRNTVAANVASYWFQLIANNQTLALLQQQSARLEDGLKILQSRYRSGQSSITDVWQQQQLLRSLETERLQAETERQTTRNLLALWLGRLPSSLNEAETGDVAQLPNVEAGQLDQDPLPYIFQRPDVQQAWLTLQATDAELTAAIRDRWPSFSLSGSYRGQAPSFSQLVDSWSSELVASLVLPLIDSGRRRATVDYQAARVKEAFANYQQRLLEAAETLDSAYTRESRQQLVVSSLTERLQLARQTEQLVQQRYRNGSNDFLSLLESQRSVLTLEQSQLDALLQLHQYRIALHQALSSGAAWPSAESASTPSALSIHSAISSRPASATGPAVPTQATSNAS